MSDDLLRFAPIALPIAGAVLGMLLEALLRKPKVAMWLTVASLAGSIVSVFGGATGLAGYGSELYTLDAAGGILTAGASAFALLALFLSVNYLKPQDDEFPGEIPILLALVPAGIGIIAGARHAMMIFLGIELLSVPLYALVALRRANAAAVEGAVKYFLLGAFAAGFITFGMSLLFASEHSLDLDALRAAAGRSPVAAAGTALFLAGLLFKLSAAPFHFWTPDAYEGAATPVTALMASTTKIGAVAGLLKITPLLPASAWPALAAIALLSIAAGNFGALLQDRVKRILAYSSVAHAGTILLALAAGLSAADPALAADLHSAASRASVYYLIAYGASAFGAFGIIAILERGGDRFRTIGDFRGLSRRQPAAAWLLTFFLLSLGGIPPTGGFWAKYFVFATAVQAGQLWIAVAGIILSVVGVAYYLRIVATCFMASEDAELGAPPQGKVPLPALLATLAAGVGVLVLGFAPAELLGLIGR
ncbi:MAG: NADH-quinone oxidoreductase subunit N [Planctomycetes bacterium]|nr:NADH-quinone oxidoreductase subunit N [Planctomycetota bacterium]